MTFRRKESSAVRFVTWSLWIAWTYASENADYVEQRFHHCRAMYIQEKVLHRVHCKEDGRKLDPVHVPAI